MENRNASAEVLNDLIEINNDRIAGYQKAIDELKDEDADLKSVFLKMVGESQQLKSALVNEVKSAGLEPEEGTTASGKIYRAWMDVKALFTGADRKTILNNCETGEDAAQKAYKMALESDELMAQHRNLIQEQKTTLRQSHDEIKRMRDSIV